MQTGLNRFLCVYITTSQVLKPVILQYKTDLSLHILGLLQMYRKLNFNKHTQPQGQEQHAGAVSGGGDNAPGLNTDPKPSTSADTYDASKAKKKCI